MITSNEYFRIDLLFAIFVHVLLVTVLPLCLADASDSFPNRVAHGLRIRRKAVYKDTSLWLNGIIPYTLTDDISSNYMVSEVIKEAIAVIETDTCVKFTALNNTDNTISYQHVSFVKSRGCHSSVGRTKDSVQEVSIGRHCGYVEMVLHELGHLLGMWHEHARPDRDNHIMVNWSNIHSNMLHNFHTQYEMRLVAPYDLSSIMHYGLKIFSADKNYNTLTPLIQDLAFMVGYRTDLSFYDKFTINTLYNCAADCSGSLPECKNDGFLDKNCQCVCPRLFIGDQCEKVITDKKCGGVYTVTESATVSSPYFPHNYANSMSCVWSFESPANTLMELKFTYFDLEIGRGGICRDQLEIRSHYIGLARGRVFCGNRLKRKFTTTSNKLLLSFLSNQSVQKSGFKATITLINRTDCSSSPCQNGGKCKQMEFYDDYYCECKRNWIGKHCEIPVMNGHVSEWSTWSLCIAGCGLQSRTRRCDNPKPQNGGRDCTQVLHESRRCNAKYTNCTDNFFCDFNEKNMCDMKTNGSSRLEWSIHKGPTPSMHTGPDSGHSSGTKDDPFVYIESSYGKTKEETTLWLPDKKWKAAIYCLQFFYHLFGTTSGSLRVIRDSTRSVNPLIIWQRSNDNGNQWYQANINVLLYDGIKIGFVGIRGQGYSSDAALDDISLSPRACSHPKNMYARGCNYAKDFFPFGPLSYFQKCRRQNCFCNPDGTVDCPRGDWEDICEGYDPYYKAKKLSIKVQKTKKISSLPISNINTSDDNNVGSGEAP